MFLYNCPGAASAPLQRDVSFPSARRRRASPREPAAKRAGIVKAGLNESRGPEPLGPRHAAPAGAKLQRLSWEGRAEALSPRGSFFSLFPAPDELSRDELLAAQRAGLGARRRTREGHPGQADRQRGAVRRDPQATLATSGEGTSGTLAFQAPTSIPKSSSAEQGLGLAASPRPPTRKEGGDLRPVLGSDSCSWPQEELAWLPRCPRAVGRRWDVHWIPSLARAGR